MRLVLTGSHSTGKTTLVTALMRLLHHYKQCVAADTSLDVRADVVSDCHLFLNDGDLLASRYDEYDPKKRSTWILADRIIHYRKWNHFIADRAPLDAVAYAMDLSYDSGTQLLIKQAAFLACNTVDLICYLPIAIPFEANSTRPKDPAFRKLIDYRLTVLLDEYRQAYPIANKRIFTIDKISKQERLLQLVQILTDRYLYLDHKLLMSLAKKLEDQLWLK